jgi:hypothetical protein
METATRLRGRALPHGAWLAQDDQHTADWQLHSAQCLGKHKRRISCADPANPDAGNVI